jgi:hypothetical protein
LQIEDEIEIKQQKAMAKFKAKPATVLEKEPFLPLPSDKPPTCE